VMDLLAICSGTAPPLFDLSPKLTELFLLHT
jgi:hypothetical protein